MNARLRTVAVLGAMLLSLAGARNAATFDLTLQRRDSIGETVKQDIGLDPQKTAVVIVDMWDRHWCETYTTRVGNMTPRMNLTLDAARQLGIQVVHAPSDVLDPYKETPQRKAMLGIPQAEVPEAREFNAPPLPWTRTGGCECGPDRPCTSGSVWRSQNENLKIADEDLIGDCNNAQELYSLCKQRGIDTLIYVGVASNMCVYGRGFGMHSMKRAGLQTIFVSDLVQAISGNGYDPDRKQADPNFTPARGTAVVQRHLERYVSPSVESRQLLAAARMDSQAEDSRPHVVFVIAEQEYNTRETLPAFARKYLTGDYRCTFVHANPDDRDDVPGLEVLYDADALVLSMRRRMLPVTQMDHLERYIRSGKPIVGLRVSIVPFQVTPEERPGGRVIWRDFDREVLGCQYRGYDSESRDAGCDVWIADGAKEHPILAGIPRGRIHSSSWIYKLNPLTESTTLLMQGRWSEEQSSEPVAFTNTYNGARVFFTSLGHPEDFKLDAFNKMMVNAISWVLE